MTGQEVEIVIVLTRQELVAQVVGDKPVVAGEALDREVGIALASSESAAR